MQAEDEQLFNDILISYKQLASKHTESLRQMLALYQRGFQSLDKEGFLCVFSLTASGANHLAMTNLNYKQGRYSNRLLSEMLQFFQLHQNLQG